MSRLWKLAVVAVLASTLPAAALAHERDCDRDGDLDRRPVGYVPDAPPPAPPPAPYWREGTWREGTWRERRIHELRADLRALETRRAEVHARFGWNPRRVWRFDGWYTVRRAELERRLYELQAVAWR
jgi:hypothetical protein